MSALLALLGWLAMLPVLLGVNWLHARYGGADYPLWYIAAGWLACGVLLGIVCVRAVRDERRAR